ncbi:MAG TPA: Wzz/FepE/Etk N-terminal domain-containing protein, partial [candidate division Zixibacteria bacterium]|nr:Wzz/FepE/Etk N-terminal domain-containing protein [candidate division Zixibacteria bacterium]
MNSKQRQDSGYKSIDLRDAFAVLAKRKWYLLVPFVIVFSSAVGVSYLLTPQFESRTILSYGNSPSLIKPLSGLVASQSEERMSSEDRRRLLAAMRNEITSSRVLSRLASELKLDQMPDIEKEAQRIRSEHPALELEAVKRDLIIEDLREHVTVDFAGKEQLAIGVLDPDPFMAQRMASRLTEIYIEERVLQDLGAVREAQELTDDQLTKFESQLQKLIDEKTDAERAFLKMQIDETIISEENRRTIRTAIDEIAGEINDLNREEVSLLEQLRGDVRLTMSPNAKISSLKQQLSEDSKSLV